MKTIPFDIKLRDQVQSEENGYKGRYKVQTKSGNSVRIICWDKKNTSFSIVALVEDSSRYYENMRSFRSNGKYYPTNEESSTDLCLIDTWEPKFNVGDIIRHKGCYDNVRKIVELNNTYYSAINPSASTSYGSNTWYSIPYQSQNLYELVPEESKLTEFEEELANCLYKSIGVVSMDGMETLAKECAPKLLELAKKEIIEKLKEG